MNNKGNQRRPAPQKKGAGKKDEPKKSTRKVKPVKTTSNTNNEARGSYNRLNKTNNAVSSNLEQQFLLKIREMGVNTFWTLAGLVNEKSVNSEVGTHLSLRWVRDLSAIVENLHSEDDFHGTIRSQSVLLDRNLNVFLESPSGVKTMNFSSNIVQKEFFEKRKHADIIALGITLLEITTGRSVGAGFCPNLSAIRDHFVTMVKQPEKKLDELSTELTDEINNAYEGLNAHPGLQEFCVRTVTRADDTRMTAQEAHAWLTGLVDRVEAVQPNDSVPHILKLLLLTDSLPRKKGPELVITKAEQERRQQIRKTHASKKKGKPKVHKGGYMSDESFYVEEEEEEKKPVEQPQRKIKTRKAKNRLSMFLQDTYVQKKLEEEMAKTQAARQENTGGRERSRSQDKDYRKVIQNFHKELDISQVMKEIEWTGKERRAIEQMKKLKELDPEDIAKRFEKQERLPLDMATALIKEVDKSLREEPNNVQLRGGAIIVGDIHGQFFDLRNLMSIAGEPGSANDDGSEKNFIFLGDYVDRGNFSCEVLFYLFALKLKYPAHVWLIRGNHESRATAGYFGFKRECQTKYGLPVFNQCCGAFQAMPIACTVTTSVGKFFCVHGGISPNVTDLHQFTEFDRFADPGISGFLCDVLWADPVELKDEDEEENYKQALGEYYSNPLRGCSYRFGLAAVEKFLKTNGLMALIRAHQVQSEGYCFHYFKDVYGDITSEGELSDIEEKMPPVITVFSAPNYQGTYGNKAAIITLLDKVPDNKKVAKHSVIPLSFEAVEEPEVVELIDEQRRQTDAIETNIPYMPTNYEDFVAKAYELEKGENLDVLSRKKPRQNSARRSKKIASGGEGAAAKRKNFLSHASPSFHQLKGLGDDPRQWGSVASRIQKYKSAAKQDRLSEINPLVQAQKMNEAKENLDEKIDELKEKLSENISIEETKKRSSMRLVRQFKQNDNGKVTFTKVELQSLQALFLLIDNGEKGHIDKEDLIKWSEDEITIAQSESEEIMGILDFDGDGHINFEDYMVFAAYIKRTWLEEVMKEQLELIQRATGS